MPVVFMFHGSSGTGDSKGFVAVFPTGLRYRMLDSGRLSVDRADRIAAAAFSGGGLDVPHESDRAVRTYATVGSLDDRVLEGPGLTELPLDPVEILASPVLAPFLDAHIETLGLGMLAGVGHQYPDRLVPEFSSFFSRHRLPAPGRA